MRVVVDRDLCQGHGMCELEAPDVFEAGRDSVNLLDETPGEARRAEVEAAVQFCPTQALKIVEE
ncbi:ferredoxin [Gordonia sp. HY002]|uniref:ferredoxin n=1 Tax=Gordonia zhenghanii TaxID=2911516 RepID=UPI001EF10B73|nr:ferredoxin [Gordonia zhenghanii]MCF8570145.1 ferredoxin [Gordonia zhenghanii]MCF8606716.1 ferredoxin [Gordonia zhenghanii]